MTSSIDIATVRKQFPALDKEQVYFDNAGGSQVLQTVVDSVSTYLATTNVQLGASYPIGKQSTSHYEAGYEAAASYVNADRSSIVLGSSTTQLFRNMSMALFEHFAPGSEIIISSMDHEANIASWVQMAKFRSVEVRWWRPTPTSGQKSNPQLDPEVLRGLMSDKTRLVACTHTSNILGTITPIRKIADVVHSFPSALLAVDAVAYAPHREVDVKALDVDIYAFSWYKLFGPHMALLYASSRAKSRMQSLGHFFKPADSLEDMLGLAGASYELLAGLPDVVKYVEGFAPEGGDARGRRSAAWKSLAEHEHVLQKTLLEYLTAEKSGHGRKITIWGGSSPDPSLRVPVISFTVEGWSSKELVLAVQERSGGRFGFRWGGFYSNRLVKEVLGLEDVDDGVVRVSLVHYNTVQEVKEYISVIDQVLQGKS